MRRSWLPEWLLTAWRRSSSILRKARLQVICSCNGSWTGIPDMYQRLIPSILIRQGRLVKGRQYGAYRDAGGPGTTARAHNAQGADELVVCDIDASKTGADPDYETLRKIADECFMPLTIFGGVNSL